LAIDHHTIQTLDGRGYMVLDAVTHAGRQGQGISASNNYVCIDGRTYWVKATAQQGLVAELIASRLARLAGAGPGAQIIRVPIEAAGTAPHLAGVGVGILDEPDTTNARELAPLLSGGQFDPASIDARSRALVVAFQTWLGVADTQVLINFKDGRVRSIDHGDCFANTAAGGDPPLILVDIPGVDASVGKERYAVEAAVRAIEGVSDRDLMEAVAQVPSGEPWRGPVARRAEIASWLAPRRDRMRTVMEGWLNS
jgi:hypothetical protein